MKAAFVKDKSVISVDETEKPTLGSADILVKMESCGICGSDLEKVFGKYGQPSMKLGHEPEGVTGLWDGVSKEDLFTIPL